MNNSESITHDGEIPIYDAVRHLTRDEVEKTVRNNAAARQFDVTDEHMNVIHSLIEHYKQDCKSRDCLAAHEHMRFLEEAYEFKGEENICTGCSTPYRTRAVSSCRFMSSQDCRP